MGLSVYVNRVCWQVVHINSEPSAVYYFTYSTMSDSPFRQFSPYEQTQIARYGVLPAVGDPWKIPQTNTTPVEYLTGKAEFCDLVIEITPEALIPRIETEELVARASNYLHVLLAHEATALPLHALDIGTGCGAVPLALAARFSPDQVVLTASEVSAGALQVARQNDKTGRITFIESDLLAQVPVRQYAVITANLPYIPHDRIPYLDPSVHAHEPHVALDGGPDGLHLIKQMLAQVPPYLHPNGVIILEVDYTHTPADFQWLASSWKAEFVHDQFERQRFVELRLS